MGCVYYHGTSKVNADYIKKYGFKMGTYFTWDLHSALVMGGRYVFGIYFENRNRNDYWEWISDAVISPNEIIYLYRFDVKIIFDNENEHERIRKINHQEQYKYPVIHCEDCKGRGQLNSARRFGWEIRIVPIVCGICGGFGCIRPDGKKINEI